MHSLRTSWRKTRYKKRSRGSRASGARRPAFLREKVVKAHYKVAEKESVDDHDFLKDMTRIDKALAGREYVKFRSIYGGGGRSRSYFINSEGSEITRTCRW